MKKILALLILLSGLVFPWACSDNKNPTQPSGPSLGSGTSVATSTFSPTGTITPGTSTATATFTPSGGVGTPTPTFAIATPVWKNNYVTGAPPNGMVLVGTSLNVVEGEPGVTSLAVYTVQGGGTLNGYTNGGNEVVLGVPTPNSTPPWAGTTVVLTDPVGVGYSSYSCGSCTPPYPGNTFAILDTSPGSSAATLYQQNPYYDGSNYTNYQNGYSGLIFNSPKGIAIDQQGNNYVADTGNGKVEAFGPPSGGGPPFNSNWEWEFDGSSSSKAFKQPWALFCDSNNNLWVGDPGYNPSVIYEFATIGTLGSGGATFLGSFTTVPNCAVHGLAVDQSASCNGVTGPCVYVADAGNNEVEEYTSTGVLLRAWTIPAGGSPPSHEYLNFSPSCVILYGNPVQNIIVGDIGNSEIQVFGP